MCYTYILYIHTHIVKGLLEPFPKKNQTRRRCCPCSLVLPHPQWKTKGLPVFKHFMHICMMIKICDPSRLQAGARGSQVQDNLGYTVRRCSKTYMGVANVNTGL